MNLAANTRIHMAGHTGMVGSAIIRRLKESGCRVLITPTRNELDLRDRTAVLNFYQKERPEVVIMAAGRVGGIQANIDDPVGFLSDNLLMAEAVINAAHATGVRKLLYLGSSCMYPVSAPLPYKEESLLCGALEPTNEAYALAKSIGVRLCQYHRQQYRSDFISCIPTNLFGPADRYDARNSHVVAALIQRFHKAVMNGDDEMTVWGTGNPLRDFLYVDDLADACLLLLEQYSDTMPVNIASGTEHSIRQLAEAIAAMVGFRGKILFDSARPDGIFCKPQDMSIMHGLGWLPRTTLEDGLALAYADYLDRHAQSVTA
jgi:GDP-L-fucose synthase